MALLFDKVDAAPVFGQDFNFAFLQWLAVLVNTLNEVISDIQNAFNLLQAQGYTSAQITDLFNGGLLLNGMILYDTDLNVYVGVQNDALVQFTTSAYP